MAQAKRKKRFFNIEIPLIKKDIQLQAYEAKELGNRYIAYDMTRLLKGKNTILKLKTIFENEEIKIKPNELRILPSFMKRVVRRGTNYVEDSFSTNSKDSQIKFKPFLVTRKKVSRAVRKALRQKAKEEIIQYAKKNETESIFEDLLKNKFQKELSLKLKKIYPLSFCEIRVLKVEEGLNKKE